MSPGPQNMKTGANALGTAENESGRAKHENGTQRPRYRRKRVRVAKHENGTQRPQYRRKCVRARKTLKPDPTHSAMPKTIPGTQNLKTGPDALFSAEN
jgi:hypothetical protein